MSSLRLSAESAGVLVSVTIGAGVFALPYLFVQAGWLSGAAVLLALGGLLSYLHWLYARVLENEADKMHMVGLARRYLGRAGQAVAAVSLLGGLLIALVAYLILAPGFFRLLLPDWPSGGVAAIFWIAGSVPLFRRLGFLVDAELWGAAFMVALIFGMFGVSPDPLTILRAPAFTGTGLAALFGAALFSLGGWTALHPMVDLAVSSRRRGYDLKRPIFVGTAAVVILYMLFVIGVVGSTPYPEADTVSNLSGFPPIAVPIIGALGLFALWTSYAPIAMEIRDSLLRDFGFGSHGAALFALVAPPTLVLLGLNSFSAVVSVGGGISTALQYIIIVLIAQRALKLHGAAKLASAAVAVAFAAAVLVELSPFVLN